MLWSRNFCNRALTKGGNHCFKPSSCEQTAKKRSFSFHKFFLRISKLIFFANGSGAALPSFMLLKWDLKVNLGQGWRHEHAILRWACTEDGACHFAFTLQSEEVLFIRVLQFLTETEKQNVQTHLRLKRILSRKLYWKCFFVQLVLQLIMFFSFSTKTCGFWFRSF